MAADLKTLQGMCPLDLFILYEDDGLFLKYKDGSSLELSPCGSAFRHCQGGPRKVEMKQLTRFAISSFRSKIIHAVRIRNLYAARPYICKELVDQQELVGYNSITCCQWPDHSSTDSVEKLSDGSAHITSLDGLASLTIVPHRQTFSVRFLTEVQFSLPKRAKVGDPQAQHQKRYFVWQEQIHSLCSYHECWKYPLQLVRDAVNLTEELPNNVAKLPESLPHTCQACHLHTWITQLPIECGQFMDQEMFWQPNMKVIWKDGAIFRRSHPQCEQFQKLSRKRPLLKFLEQLRPLFRFFQLTTGLFTVEIDPGDGSVMRSQTASGRYYNHWFVEQNQKQGVKIQERVYSADKPPPDRLLRGQYSVGRLLKHAASFMEFLSSAGQQSEKRCCWKEASNSLHTFSKPFHPAHVVETADVPGTGRFKAYSNRNINVVFSDRTILDLTDDKDNSSCQLVLPSGGIQQFRLTDAEQCAVYQKYLQAAHHWREWVKATPSQRRTFYKDTVWDPEKRGAVSNELQKIKRFDYLYSQQFTGNVALRTINNSQNSTEELEGGKDSLKLCGLPDREAMIKRVLEQNNKAIDDINGLLNTLKCSSQNVS